MRLKINHWAHKYLPEILCILVFIILLDIYFGTSQRTEIKEKTDKTLLNQETSLINDSLAAKKLNNIESSQKIFIDDAKELRKTIRVK